MAISKIKSNSIADDAITSDKVADGTVIAADVADGTLTNAKINASAAIDYSKLNLTGNIALADLSATGTKDATTFLRGDNTFASAGSPSITDNGNANAITIDSNERVQFTRPRSNTLGDSALEILPSDTVVGMGFRMENTNNDLVIEKSSPSGSEAEILRIRQGGGIALGGTGDANTLDDYEEGTWTPALINGGSPSYSTQDGKYTKIGRMVICTFYLVYTSASNSSSTRISGLPFVGADDPTTRQGYISESTDTNRTADGLWSTSISTTAIQAIRVQNSSSGNLQGTVIIFTS